MRCEYNLLFCGMMNAMIAVELIPFPIRSSEVTFKHTHTTSDGCLVYCIVIKSLDVYEIFWYVSRGNRRTRMNGGILLSLPNIVRNHLHVYLLCTKFVVSMLMQKSYK